MDMMRNTDKSLQKHWLGVTLIAVIMALSGCRDTDQSTMEGSVHEFNFQTSPEEAAAEIEAYNAPMISDRKSQPGVPGSDENDDASIMGDGEPLAHDEVMHD